MRIKMQIEFKYLTDRQISSLRDTAECLYNNIQCYYISDIPKKYKNLSINEYNEFVSCVHRLYTYLDSGNQKALFKYCKNIYCSDMWTHLGHNIYNPLFIWMKKNRFDLKRRIIW